MKPLGQAWGGRGRAQVGGRGRGRGVEVGPPAPPPPPPPTQPQSAQLRGSRGGWREAGALRAGAVTWDPCSGHWRSEEGLSPVPAGPGATRAGGGSEGSPGAQPPPRH